MPPRKAIRARSSVAWDAKRFHLAPAYSGGALILGDYRYPVVVDLAGLVISSQVIEARKEHDAARVVGRTTRIEVTSRGIEIHGEVNAANRDGEEIIAASRGGFAWEASIGASAETLEEVEAGQTVSVNGQQFTGPVLVARRAVLSEVSFVPRGADVGKTRVAIAAKAKLEGSSMTFEEWLTSIGFDPATLSADQVAGLKSAYEKATAAPPAESEVEAADGDPEEEEAAVAASAKKAKPAAVKAASPNASIDDLVAEMRRQQAAEIVRVGKINRICAGMPDVAAKAVTEGWTAEQAELHVLRASRGNGPYIATGGDNANANVPRAQVLQAALSQVLRHKDAEKGFSPQVLEAAHERYRGRISLGQVMIDAAMANGYRGDYMAIKTDLRNVLRAAFSTNDIGDILSNTANKSLKQGFESFDDSWRRISAIGTVNDFKTVTHYRLLDNAEFAQVGPTGEIAHGVLTDETFTNAANTYAKMLAITRTDLINDDLGALDAVPRRLGRGGASKLNAVFWAAFCDNSSFFADPSAHFYKGSDSVLAAAGLTKVTLKFRTKTNTDGHPLGVEPKILLVPAALAETARDLMGSPQLTGGSTAGPATNSWANRYEIVVSPYLDNASYGNSSVIWYLLADPNDVAVIETVFLNGQQTPTVEQAEADFNVLGVQMRGYFDFGVTKQDARGGVKSKGAA